MISTQGLLQRIDPNPVQGDPLNHCEIESDGTLHSAAVGVFCDLLCHAKSEAVQIRSHQPTMIPQQRRFELRV
jgi:hypothetical protein